MAEPSDPFEVLLRGWVDHASAEWGYPPALAEQFDAILARLPAGLRALVVNGHESGLIEPVGGHQFTLRGLTPGKGPYAWVARDATSKTVTMNWEYLVQAAEYARVYAALTPRGYVVGVEDRLMDITVSDLDGTLLWYLEVKVRADEVQGLVKRVINWGHQGIDLLAPDRGDDPLRKAKYLIHYRPRYFSVVAIGIRLDFVVAYKDANRFRLTEDMVPFA